MRCDLVLRQATLVDGSGGPPVLGDLAVRGGRIAATGDLGGWRADRDIDATGLAVSPGFIDAHTHDDRAVLCGPACMRCKTSQGVTTVVVGNCGISLSPTALTARPPPPLDLLGEESWWRFDSFAAYAEALERTPPAVNVVALVGHMALRAGAMDRLDRPATGSEIARMHDRLAAALDQGASGFSTGLYYPASAAATTDEAAGIAAALRGRGRVYAAHMRDEADRILDAIAETAAIGRAAASPVVVSHHKCAMPENYGRSAETLAALNAAGADFDVYPYAAGSTVLMPEKLRPDVAVRLTWSVPHPDRAGQDLDAIAAEWGIDRIAAAHRLLPAGAVIFQMREDDVRRILSHPRAMIGSDGLPHDSHPHPRLWGTFPRVLGHYVREGLFSLAQAVHRMTGRPAAVFGLTGRGTLAPGAFADLVLFDPATVRDLATYDDPVREADGILRVWVNGRETYRHGTPPLAEGFGQLLTSAR